MASWVTPIAPDAVEDGKEYFLGKNIAAADFPPLWYFVAKDIKGKTIMSQKPGIARRFVGGDGMRAVLLDHPELSAVPVPANADARWVRRKRRMKGSAHV